MNARVTVRVGVRGMCERVLLVTKVLLPASLERNQYQFNINPLIS